MKKSKLVINLILCLLINTFLFAQTQLTTSSISNECGFKPPANYNTWRNNVLGNRNMVTTLKHDTCLNKKFSVVFYVILDSNYAWGGNNMTPADLNTCISNLNNAFKPICVSFLNCSTVVIPVFPYNGWRDDITEPVVTSNWYTDKTINIYLVDTIKNPNGKLGYAYGPGGKDLIVIDKEAILGTTPIHEMGHFFGLMHTFDDLLAAPNATITSELVTRNAGIRNCYTNGDGFCDTDADCFPNGFDVNAQCTIQHGPKDANQEYFIPPVDNYMTYFRNCRCKFSQEQYNFMARVIATQLIYLH